MRVPSLGREDLWRRAWLPTPVFLPGECRAIVHRVTQSQTRLKRILASVADLSTQWLWFFNAMNNNSVVSMLGSAWTSSLSLVRFTLSSDLLPTWLKKKRISPVELNLLIAFSEKNADAVRIAWHSADFLNSWPDQGKQDISSSKRELWPKWASQSRTIDSKCTFLP